MKNKGSETFLEARIMVLSLKWTMWLLNDVQQYVVKRNTRFLNSGGKEGNEKLAWKELELQWSRKEIRNVRNTHLLIKGAFFLCFYHTQLWFPSVPHPSKLLISRLAVAHSRSHLRCLQVSSLSLPALAISTLIQLNY